MPHLDPARPEFGHRELTAKKEPKGIFTLPGIGALPDFLEDIIRDIIDPSIQIGGVEVSPKGAAAAALTALALPAVGVALPAAIPAIGGTTIAATGGLGTAATGLGVAGLLGAIAPGFEQAFDEGGTSSDTEQPEIGPPTDIKFPGTGISISPATQSRLADIAAQVEDGTLTPEQALALSEEAMEADAQLQGIDISESPPLQIVTAEVPDLGTVTGIGIQIPNPVTGKLETQFFGQPFITAEVQARIAQTQALTEQSIQAAETARVQERRLQQGQEFAQGRRGPEAVLNALDQIQQFQQFSATPAGRKLTEALGGVNLPQLLLQGLGLGDVQGGGQFNPLIQQGSGQITAQGISPEVAGRFNLPALPASVTGQTPATRGFDPLVISMLGQAIGQSTRGILPGVGLDELQFAGTPRRSFIKELAPEQRQTFDFLSSIVG